MRVAVDWTLSPIARFDNSIKKYKRYLQDQGLRESTMAGYIGNLERYLDYVKTDEPSAADFEAFRHHLQDLDVKRNTLNQYGYAIRAYHKMKGNEIKYKRLEPNNQLPSYFSEDDVNKIFSVINNIKHLAMLMTLFYGCLRASELCGLNDEDLELDHFSIRVRNGKGGQDGMVFINNETAKTLRDYLRIRPSLLIDGQRPLFYTDYRRRWKREEVYRIFMIYKKNAGVKQAGGLHVFSRHTPATIMVKNGCDICIIKDILRHEDIRTTLRYTHISTNTKRNNYEKYFIV